MLIWKALGRTDPKHTKQFTRAGGFRGTAIRPHWANMQMTEFFGPCGSGWGQTEPTFQTMAAGEEILVYCTVGMWYLKGDIKQGPVYGVGGDKVMVKDKNGFRADDEAFKKAYTDALGNAMKFIGVAADVHMGLFDDNKYVQSVGAEFEEQKKAEVFAEVERQKAASPTLDKPTQDIPPQLDWSWNKGSGVLICRPGNIKKAKNKKGTQFLVVTLNGYISDKNEAFYFHKTYVDELVGAQGKVCKFMMVESKGFVNIDSVLEIDGAKVGQDTSAETECRLLASVLELDEEDLRELYSSVCQASWTLTLEALKQRKSEVDAGVEVGSR